MSRKLRTFKLSDLKPPRGWEGDEKRIASLAESFKSEGQLTPILVMPSGHILCGKHRWAAAELAGWTHMECVVDNTEEQTADQAEAKVIAENLIREHLTASERNELLLRLVDLREKEIRKAQKKRGDISGQLSENAAKLGRKPSPRTEAVRQIAKEQGSDPETLRKADDRRDVFTMPGGGAPEVAPAFSGPTDAIGAQIPEAHRTRWALIRPELELVDRHLQSAQAAITRLLTAAGSGPEPEGIWIRDKCQRWRAEVHTVAHDIRATRPYAVCVYCKGAKKDCTACRGLGFVSEAQYERAPADLRGEAKSARSVMETIGA